MFTINRQHKRHKKRINNKEIIITKLTKITDIKDVRVSKQK